ncbi:hypothetical protein D0860_06505 [Hortaea werneckii]|uniref:Uncharacterized protein n=1 Tax=Hortaea werneckii TaxID=91943 RepID=A0A3M7GSL5_HORWE|nr:hypothetical protein D0860_06505 [Hortaea werneckii]
MDRDRRRREPDFQDQYGRGGGQSYRPGGARERSPPPPRSDSYRSARSPPPPRRGDFGGDTYRTRPRSRSPPPRRDDYRRPLRSPTPPRYRDARDVRRGGVGGGDTYRGRPRSPAIRREELPRDDLFRRDPEPSSRDYRDTRDYRDEQPLRDYRDERDLHRGAAGGGGGGAYAGRSPAAHLPPPTRYRDRSPLPLKRGREPSPLGGSSRGRRTPPPAKRERLVSPPPAARGRYDDYPPSSRAVSPPPRGRYSPDAAPRRERRPTPPRGVTRDYRLHSRSPLARNERIDPRNVDWRRPALRSPSPSRGYARAPAADYMDIDSAPGRDSGATSRRSSPPVHPGRLTSMQPTLDDRPSRAPPPRDPYDDREPYRAAARSPEPPRRRDSPPPSRREYPDDRGSGYTAAAPTIEDRIPPPREPYRPDDVAAPAARAPPSGPAGYRGPSAGMAPPSGPAAAVSVSAHNRAPAGPPPAGPAAGPRGSMGFGGAPRGEFGGPRGRGGFRGGGFRGGFDGGFRGGRGGGVGGSSGMPPYGGGGRGESFNPRESFDSNAGVPPPGPRGSFSQAAAAAGGGGGPPPAIRQGSNSTATTYPRSQRFAPNGQPIPDGPSSTPPTGPRAGRRPPDAPGSGLPPSGPSADSRPPRMPVAPTIHPAIASLPKLVDGGQKADPLIDETKLGRLQDEAERLRRQIEERELKKRKGLREWDRLSREVEVAGLRSELAEQSVRELNGEAESQAAF